MEDYLSKARQRDDNAAAEAERAAVVAWLRRQGETGALDADVIDAAAAIDALAHLENKP